MTPSKVSSDRLLSTFVRVLCLNFLIQGASFNDFLDALDGVYCTYEGGDDPTQDAIYPDPYGGYQGPKACGTVKYVNFN